MQEETPYEILGVSQKATIEEIRKAYRSLAKRYHPDMHPNDPNAASQFQKVNDAYLLLQDETKRAELDALLEKSSQAVKGSRTARQPQKGTVPPDWSFLKFGREWMMGSQSQEKEKQAEKTANQGHPMDQMNQQFAKFFGFGPTKKKK